MKGSQKSCLSYAVAIRPMVGQSICGDLAVVRPLQRGLLLAVIDGAGHGQEAAQAARTAADVLESSAEENLLRLVEQCHKKMIPTRGAAMTVVSVHSDTNTAEWVGVGDVEARLFRGDPERRPRLEGAMLRGGIVGYQLPTLRADRVDLQPGDWLVMATDGIRADFPASVRLSKTPEAVAEDIVDGHFKETDDALVLVARYLGKEP